MPNNSLIYPNPISEGRVSFKEKAVVFQLYDAKGTLVKTGTDVDGFSVDGLQRGIYFIKIDGKSEKLIIE